MGFLDFLKKDKKEEKDSLDLFPEGKKVTPETPVSKPQAPKDEGGEFVEELDSVPLPPPSVQDPEFEGSGSAEEEKPQPPEDSARPQPAQEPTSQATQDEAHRELPAPQWAPPSRESPFEEPKKEENSLPDIPDIPDFTEEDLAGLAPDEELPEPEPEVHEPEASKPEKQVGDEMPPQKPKAVASDKEDMEWMPERRKAPQPSPEPPRIMDVVTDGGIEEAVPEEPDRIVPVHARIGSLEPARFLGSDRYFDIVKDIRESRKALRNGEAAISDALSHHEQEEGKLSRFAAEVNAIQEAFVELDEALFEE